MEEDSSLLHGFSYTEKVKAIALSWKKDCPKTGGNILNCYFIEYSMAVIASTCSLVSNCGLNLAGIVRLSRRTHLLLKFSAL